MRKIILKDKSFWPSAVYSIKTTKYLVEVLKLVDANKVPTMGSLYHDMDLAKETKSEKLRKRL